MGDLLLTYGSRGAGEPMVRLAVQLRALGTRWRVCAPPEGAAAEGCDADRDRRSAGHEMLASPRLTARARGGRAQ